MIQLLLGILLLELLLLVTLMDIIKCGWYWPKQIHRVDQPRPLQFSDPLINIIGEARYFPQIPSHIPKFLYFFPATQPKTYLNFISTSLKITFSCIVKYTPYKPQPPSTMWHSKSANFNGLDEFFCIPLDHTMRFFPSTLRDTFHSDRNHLVGCLDLYSTAT